MTKLRNCGVLCSNSGQPSLASPLGGLAAGALGSDPSQSWGLASRDEPCHTVAHGVSYALY